MRFKIKSCNFLRWAAKLAKICFPSLCCLLGLLLSGVSLQAQQAGLEGNGRRVLTALRLGEVEFIRLDGNLDEPAWDRAVPATDFLQSDPLNGELATERTEVRALFDQHRLYLGVICYDSEPDKLLGKQMQRDQPLSGDDRFMWTIDPYMDGRSGYFFEVNPSGLMGDGLLNSGGGGRGGGGHRGGGGPPGGGGFGINKSWDGIWNVRVQRNEIGWTIEIEIPFRTLNFDANAPAWGINFQRTVRRKNEESLWMGYPRNQGLFRMSNAGLLEGLFEINQGFGLDFKPYVVGSIRQAPGDGVPSAVKSGDVGADFFYNLTPGLRANFTLNTDFAETEVDDRFVNLTRFPLRFPEKRAFFLEGSNFFDFAPNQVEPFFSRRIGLNEESDLPQAIDFGGKLTGQLGAFDLGFLQIRTANEGEFTGEDFTVLRTRRRFLQKSYLGMLYTRRAARLGPEPERHTLGMDFVLATSQFRGSQNLELTGFYVWNNNPLGTGKSKAYGMRINYPNDVWRARASYRELQENYDPALGFTRRENIRRFNPALFYSPRPEGHPWIRRFNFGTNMELVTDLSNRTITRRLDVSVFHMFLHSGDNVAFRIHPTHERLEKDFEILEDEITLPEGNQYRFTRYEFEARTAQRRWMALGMEYTRGSFLSGTRREVSLDLNFRPRKGVLVNLEGEWNRIELAEGNFSTSLVRTVVRNQFNPWISLVNNIQFDSVSRELGWQSRLRWIIRPGNDLFFVYTHNWVEERFQFVTHHRIAAAKLSYTHRF